MATLTVSLFGRLCLRGCDGQPLSGFEARKIQELFCYLLLHRDHSYPREVLASLLWGDFPTEQSKKYLRQALWQLQCALDRQGEPLCGRLLRVDPDWVGVDSQADLWLDVATFEQAFAPVQNTQGHDLDIEKVQMLQRAVKLYQGDLLEGWYQDWCLYERERLQNMYLAMLDKLMNYCEANREYETGIGYGIRILALDRAREHTHRRLMRLYYRAGNRTAALRQYQRCTIALHEELAVKPARQTVALYEQICRDQLDGFVMQSFQGIKAPDETTHKLPEMLGRLTQLRELLTDIQQALQQGIQAVEGALNGGVDADRSNR